MRQDHAPSDLQRTIRNVRKLIGIVQLRKARGISLQEALEQFERQEAQAAAAASTTGAAAHASPALTAQVRAAMAQGQKIEAIRLLRAQSGLGLKEAKEAVEAFADAEPAVGPRSAPAPKPPPAIAPATELAPGEVPASGSAVWVWMVVALVMAGLYLSGW